MKAKTDTNEMAPKEDEAIGPSIFPTVFGIDPDAGSWPSAVTQVADGLK